MLDRHPYSARQIYQSLVHNDGTVASAVLDRLLNNSDVVVIEGKSYRMRERIED